MKPRLREILILAGIVIAASAICLAVFNLSSQLKQVETYFADLRVALRPSEPIDPNIIIVTINEDTLAQFPYRSPVDRKYLADLLRKIEARGARGILLDILFDQGTEEEKDNYMKETIRGIKIPLAISYGLKEDAYLTDEQQEYLDDFVPFEIRGFANMVYDQINITARWIFPGKNLPDGRFLPSVTARLAAKLGVTPPKEQVTIDYRGQPDYATQPFPMYPSQNIDVLPKEWFANKIVLVGGDYGFIDRKRVPMAVTRPGNLGEIPGIEVLAYALSQIMDGRPGPDIPFPIEVAIVVAFAAIGMALGRMDTKLTYSIGGALLLIIGYWIFGYELYRSITKLVPLVTPTVSMAIALWATASYVGQQDRNQKKFIQQAFSKYLSPALLEEIVRDPTSLSLDARRREMSFIFTDVAGFTTISESMDASELALVLNRYLDGVCRVIFAHGGTVDKFIGDAVFAIFNAPRSQEDHAKRAVQCALAIDEFADRFLREENERGAKFGMTRIGVHSGSASVGNFGSADRFEYTALGDAVNTAARLEGLNKYFGTRVCVSGAAAAQSPEQPFRRLGQVVLKGKTQAIEVMEPLSAERAQSDFIKEYNAAFALLEAGKEEAVAAFTTLHEKYPDDGPVELHLERIKEGARDIRVEMSDK